MRRLPDRTVNQDIEQEISRLLDYRTVKNEDRPVSSDSVQAPGRCQDYSLPAWAEGPALAVDKIMISLAEGPLAAVGRAIELISMPRAARQEIRADRSGRLYADVGPEKVVKAGIDWLSAAQDNSPNRDGGVARHYSLESGWGNSYPETTGYIVPTFLNWHRRSGDEQVRHRAHQMLRWFRKIQFPEGGFQGGMIGMEPKVPVTFNTGQILIGLAAGVESFGEEFLPAMHAAAGWLVNTQDSDGAWRKHPTPFASQGEKTYETHVAWGLFEAARVDDTRGYGEAGIRNVDWALKKQHDNGWFDDCCLDQPATPLTHTIGYAVRGILECWRYSGERKYLEAAERTLSMMAKQLGDDGRLWGRFDSQWRPAVRWVCITGCSQLAECFLIVGNASGSDQFVECGKRLNRFVRRTVTIDGPGEIRGGVKGSYPVDGDYGKLQFLNWAVKFTIDANLREIDLANSADR